MNTNWKKDRNFGYRWRHHIEACTCGPLVYIRNLKCASTFFYKNLIDNCKWNEIAFTEIDWNTQRVFGHIQDPVQRRHSAISEYVFMTSTQDLYYQNAGFKEIIDSASLLDKHSLSYNDTFGHYCWLIDWIPLTGSHHDVIQVTEKLLEHYHINTPKWDFGWAHYGDPAKKKLAEDLKSAWELGIEDTAKIYLEKDIALWNMVTEKFNPTKQTWPEITWLRDREVYY
jgi:hypothetical protein